MTLRILLTVSLLALVGCDADPLLYPPEAEAEVQGVLQHYGQPECVPPPGFVMDPVIECPGFHHRCVACTATTPDLNSRTSIAFCHPEGRIEACAATCNECSQEGRR